jgi:hypothetical protein
VSRSNHADLLPIEWAESISDLLTHTVTIYFSTPVPMSELKVVQAEDLQSPLDAINEKELDSKTYPDVPNLETETPMPEVELSNLWLIVLGAAFLALWATNVRSTCLRVLVRTDKNRLLVYFRLL